jgi:RNA polymerase sigma-70 factor, ECF subfamily
MVENLGGHKQQELDLLARAKAGDPKAWGALLEPIRARLVPAVRKIVGNKHEAEDLVQEALLTMYVEMNRFRGESRLYTWAWRVAERDALNLLRDEANRRRLLREHTTSDAGAWSPAMGEPPLTPENAAANRQSLGILHRALDALSLDEQKTLLTAIEEDESEDTETPRTAVPSNLRVTRYRARQKLREVLTLMRKEDER